MPRFQWQEKVPLKFLVNATLFVILTIITVSITALYISSERNFHWWIDWHYAAVRIATTFRESPVEAFKLIQESLVEERNRLYTIPLMPFILFFGDSLVVYVVSLALVYLLPFALVMGAIATQLIQAYPLIVFWSTAFLTLLIPVNWVPTFMGIPDTGGALFIALATLIYLQDVKLKRWWQIPLIGFFLGTSILLRRPFVYGSLTFLGGLSLQALIYFAVEVQKTPQKAWWNLLGFGVKIGIISAISFATLMIVAPEFTHAALTVNYKTYYVSWSLPFSDIFQLYSAFYGWGTWLLVAIGFSAAILTRAVSLPAISFIGLSGVLSLFVWLIWLRYGNIFYSLQVTPLVAIGLVACIWTTWVRLSGKVRKYMLSAIACYLVANLTIGLTPIGKMSSLFYPLFAISNPPLVRQDYDEVIRLVDYLRKIASHDEAIFVAGSQRLQLDGGLVRGVEFLVHGKNSQILNVLVTPQVNSRDFYPLEPLLQAEYVVVPNHLAEYPGVPVQVPAVGEWLPNKEHKVVQVVLDAFTKNWEIAKDFKRLPVKFTLEGNTIVSIYQRIRSTSVETAVKTLHAIQKEIPQKPGGQSDWLVLTSGNSSVAENTDNTYQLVAQKSDKEAMLLANRFRKLQQPGLLPTQELIQQQGTSFLYMGTLPPKTEVTGQVTSLQKPCISLSLRLATLNQKGKVFTSTEEQYFPKGSANFELAMPTKKSAYLLLDVLSYDEDNLVNSCKIEINSLEVSG